MPLPESSLFRLKLVQVLAFFAALACIFVPRDAHAYAWMIKHSYGGCPTCHADPSGGELLTPYGRAQSDLLLMMHYKKSRLSAESSKVNTSSNFDSFDSFDTESGAPAAPSTPFVSSEPVPDDGPGKASGFLWGLWEPPSSLLLGGAYRHLLLKSGDQPIKFFPMQLDLFGQFTLGNFRVGGSVGGARVAVGSPYARAAQITTNQGDEWNLISRTHYVGYDFGNGRYTLRAGRLNLPFGVRMPEHTMWARRETRTDRESAQQHGVALAVNNDTWRAEIMAIAGNYQINPDMFRERGYSLYVEKLLTPRTALGLSSLITYAERDRRNGAANVLRQAHGAFTRLTLTDQLVLLAEADVLAKTDTTLGYVGFVQADYELVQGLHLLGTGEFLDAGFGSGQKLPGLGKPSFGGWLTVYWFFLPHMEMRVDGVFRQEEKATVLLQLHVFL